MTSASVQAAVYVRERQKLRLNKKNNLRKGRYDLPTHVATKDIAPFPTFPPTTWGKAAVAWLEKERRGGGLSPLGEVPSHFLTHHHRLKSTSESHRRWAKRSKIQDSSFGESSSDEIRAGLDKQYDSAANMLLYIGLCSVALGLVIAFVGTGEKGFKTVELRLIGPTIVGFGLTCCTLRIFLCFCPTKYMRRKFKHRNKNKTDNAISEEAELNRHAFHNAHALEYYKHLPFRTQMSTNLLLFEQSSMMQYDKKQVLIDMKNEGGKRVKLIDNSKVPDLIMDDTASDNLSTLKELSHEEDLIDFQYSSNSYENLPSLGSSLEYLNNRADSEAELSLIPYCNLSNEEQLSRLKSTLTFGDSNDRIMDTRLMTSYDEFDFHEDLDEVSNLGTTITSFTSPTKPESSSKELVLNASNLGSQN